MKYLLYDFGLRGVGEEGGCKGLLNSQYHSNKEIIDEMEIKLIE